MTPCTVCRTPSMCEQRDRCCDRWPPDCADPDVGPCITPHTCRGLGCARAIKGRRLNFASDPVPVADGLAAEAADALDQIAAAGQASDASYGPYGDLLAILADAYEQSATGKGATRHANGRPWADQPIMTITRSVGIGFPLGQAIKKALEAQGMLGRGECRAARAELLGAIVYLAAAVRRIDEAAE
jgi:hypothetical protein